MLRHKLVGATSNGERPSRGHSRNSGSYRLDIAVSYSFRNQAGLFAEWAAAGAYPRSLRRVFARRIWRQGRDSRPTLGGRCPERVLDALINNHSRPRLARLPAVESRVRDVGPPAKLHDGDPGISGQAFDVVRR